MTFQELAKRYHAHENVDARSFQPRARLLQAIWREEQGYDSTTYRGKIRGARLPMPWAKESLANYLTETIRDVVRAEVLDPEKPAKKLYGQPRVFNNLLSSQPLCFNLFGELQRDLEVATKVFRTLSDGLLRDDGAGALEGMPARADLARPSVGRCDARRRWARRWVLCVPGARRQRVLSGGGGRLPAVSKRPGLLRELDARGCGGGVAGAFDGGVGGVVL